MTLLNSSLRIPKNFNNFFPISDEKKISNSLKAISRRHQNNVLLYDFDSLPLEDLLRRSNAVFKTVFRKKIDSEKLKGTPYIVIKVDPNESEIVKIAK
ncbi:MAG TPA: hypothetical protein VGP47_11415, partial [Parachlamydiaceae bacterium]|nr:hypothetical protein [Parachlamydiaceae bacterium]